MHATAKDEPAFASAFVHDDNGRYVRCNFYNKGRQSTHCSEYVDSAFFASLKLYRY